jgi:WD40 repeat protein
MKTRTSLIALSWFIILAGAILSYGAPVPAPPPPKERATLKGHKDSIDSLSFSPDGKILASASGDKTIKLWDVVKGKEIATLKGHRDSVRSIVFSPDGKMLVSGGMDRCLRIWDVAAKKEIELLTDRLGITDTLVFHRDGKTLYSGLFWDIPTRKMRAEIKEKFPQDGRLWPCVGFNADGKLLGLVTHRLSPTMEIWDVAANKALRTLERPEQGVFFGRCGAFSPDGKLLGMAARWLCVWDVQTGKLLGTYKRPGDTTVLAFSPNGKLLAAAWQRKPEKPGDNRGGLSILDAASGKELATLKGHEYPIMCLAFSPDGKTLASGGSGDFLIKLWDIRGVQAPKKKD